MNATIFSLVLLLTGGESASSINFILDVNVVDAPTLSCRYVKGVTILLPTAQETEIRSEQENSLTVPADWQAHGGRILKDKNPAYTLRTPEHEGLFVWLLGEDPVEVLIVRPAEREGRRLKVADRWETYPDPSRAGSRRVRSHVAYYAPPLLILPLDERGNFEFAPGLAGRCFLPLNREEKRSSTAFALSPTIVNKIHIARLLLKEAGIAPEALKVVSGFRPPSYNRRVEGAALYSRHIYGDAVDVIIDADGDGKMDDLTGDKRVNRDDGIYLAGFFRKAETLGATPGGIGVYEYPAPSERASHVHVDARGFVTRWGVQYLRRRPSSFRWWPEGEFEEEEE